MPNPEAAPQRPGKFTIDLTPGSERIDIDGYRIEQHVTAIRLVYSAENRRPVLRLDFLPSTVDVTGERVDLHGDFRDFLIAHGWRAPE